MLVGTDLPEPDVYTRVHDGNGSGASYDKLDRHNRVTTSAWWKDLSTDQAFYDLDITYADTNITVLEDNIWTGRDVDLDYDGLNRLTNAEEGTWGGSSISSTTREQKWPTLTQLGGWHDVQLDPGIGAFTTAMMGTMRATRRARPKLRPKQLSFDGKGFASRWRPRISPADVADAKTPIFVPSDPSVH